MKPELCSPQNFQDNNPNKLTLKNISNNNNNNLLKDQGKLLQDKNNIPNPVQKALINPKLQAIFARSNSPKDNTNQTNPIQNTNALLNKLNLAGNAVKFNNNKDESNFTFANKGSPKGGNSNQTNKLQDQIKQLQQEQMSLQKKIPQMYQNVMNETKPIANNNNKLPINYNLANKLGNHKDLHVNDLGGTILNKSNFENSGSPKGQINANSKPIPANMIGNQNPSNLYQNFLNQKGKK